MALSAKEALQAVTESLRSAMLPTAPYRIPGTSVQVWRFGLVIHLEPIPSPESPQTALEASQCRREAVLRGGDCPKCSSGLWCVTRDDEVIAALVMHADHCPANDPGYLRWAEEILSGVVKSGRPSPQSNEETW